MTEPLRLPAAVGADAAISIRSVSKTYNTGFKALDGIDLDIAHGEIFALLGPNGAGKTTLISIVCGLTAATTGTVLAEGLDVVRQKLQARALIGLVPQELATESFESVMATLKFSRGLFGKPPNPALLEKILRDLTLWDKRDAKILTLSGGMKRRVMIAKALAHEPRILFLDEPTAGVDVELRRDMWRLVRHLRATGVTIVLTTHYIEEAEEMADRIGVINHGRLVLVEDKAMLMRKLGTSEMRLILQHKLASVPEALAPWNLTLSPDGTELTYAYDAQSDETGIAKLLREVDVLGIPVKNLHTRHSSLEEIFVNLVSTP
jgi:ABC-2 type transport system ATP-binding protein